MHHLVVGDWAESLALSTAHIYNIAEGDVTTSRKNKVPKQGTRKSYNGPDRSGYALDGGGLGSRYFISLVPEKHPLTESEIVPKSI